MRFIFKTIILLLPFEIPVYSTQEYYLEQRKEIGKSADRVYAFMQSIYSPIDAESDCENSEVERDVLPSINMGRSIFNDKKHLQDQLEKAVFTLPAGAIFFSKILSKTCERYEKIYNFTKKWEADQISFYNLNVENKKEELAFIRDRIKALEKHVDTHNKATGKFFQNIHEPLRYIFSKKEQAYTLYYKGNELKLGIKDYVILKNDYIKEQELRFFIEKDSAAELECIREINWLEEQRSFFIVQVYVKSDAYMKDYMRMLGKTFDLDKLMQFQIKLFTYSSYVQIYNDIVINRKNIMINILPLFCFNLDITAKILANGHNKEVWKKDIMAQKLEVANAIADLDIRTLEWLNMRLKWCSRILPKYDLTRFLEILEVVDPLK